MGNRWELLIMLFFTFISCKTTTVDNSKNMKKDKVNYQPNKEVLFTMTTEDTFQNKVANRLNEIGYAELFLYGSKSLSDSIWNKGANEKDLKNLIMSSKVNKSQKFLASEILYLHSQNYPSKDVSKFLPEVYAYSLELTDFNNNTFHFHLNGNAWGFMYDFDNSGFKSFGDLGPHLISNGKDAIPFLKKLFTNNSHLFYEGSKEATIGAMLNYRVKDAAAFYIGEILNINVAYHEDLQSRDVEIELLKKKLTEY